MEVNANHSDLSMFEDPINMQPLKDVIRCPHEPSHYYEVGTLLKRTERGILYFQCALANQWFPASEFKNDRFASEASSAAHEIHQLYLKEKDENQKNKIKNQELEKRVVNLTEDINKLLKQSEEEKKFYVLQMEKKDELLDKTIREFKELILLENEKHYKEQKNYATILDTYCTQFDKQNKIIQELKNQNEKLFALQENKGVVPEDKKVAFYITIAVAIAAVGSILWSYKKIVTKVQGLI